MQELFSDNGHLVSKNEWKRRINPLYSDVEHSDSEDTIAKEIKRLVEEAVKIRIEDLDSFGICFSGGLDSSLIAAICKKRKANFTCYTVGFQDGNFKEPEDIAQAQKVAKFLKLKDEEFKFKIFSIKEIEPIIKKTITILKDASKKYGLDINNVVNVGVGAVEVASHSISKKEKIFFSGLGSEEIFAGYDRHKKNPSNEECYNGLLNMYERDLLRDSAIPNALRFSFKTPFLDEKLVKYALKIPIKYKVNEKGSKMILRKAAINYLDTFSERPKRAAQYGSSFDRALEKLTKMHGLEFKKEYIRRVL